MIKNRISTRELMLRCYANKRGDRWQAICIDLCLAVQGNSFREVKQKLESMMLPNGFPDYGYGDLHP